MAQIDPLLNRTSFAYDASWNQIRVMNPLGEITTSVFDTSNRLVATIDALANRNSISYDLADDPIRMTNPLGFITTNVFDKLLRTVAASIRCSIGRPRRSTSPVGPFAFRTPTPTSRPRSMTRPAASRAASTPTVFVRPRSYDAASRRVALVDANGHRNSFVYDADSRQTQSIDPLGRRTTYGFDAVSRQTLRIDARGFRTSYVYDNDNRLTGQHYPDGTRVTFAYDNASRRTLLNDWTGRTTSMFDADGRLSAVISPAGLRLTYGYDAASQRKYLTEPEGARFTYSFDAAGRTNYVMNPQAQRATWSYDAASRVTGIHYANTTRTSYLYDNASRLLRVLNLSSTSTTLSSFSYALDAVGNRLRVVESTGNRVTWSYDKTYQLKNEQRSGSNGYNITYTYDPVGNRLVLINGGVRTTSSYDAANELTRSQAVRGHHHVHLRRGRQPADQPESIDPDHDQHLGFREPADPGGAAVRDRGYVHLQRRWPAGAEDRLDRHDKTRLGRAEHLAGDRRKQYHPGSLHVAADALWQFDLAAAERHDVVLPVRWAGVDDPTGQQHGHGDRQLSLRFVGNILLTTGSTT